MPSPFVFLLAVLAVYRLSHMVALEDGPFDVFANLREKTGQTDWIGRGLHCALCISFWLSGFFGVVWLWLLTGIVQSPYSTLFWLGTAGGCLVLHKLLYRDAD